jgi:dipeptidyl aminopeptidase/acylaminoacyl peptidase
VVPLAQSRRLVAALRRAGIETSYLELADAGHDDLGWSRVGPAVLAFLDHHLRPGT